MPIRLIASDVDDTLLRPDKSVGPRTLDALAAARAAGIAFVPISGRHPFSIRGALAGTGLEGPAIGSNGAVAADLTRDLVLFEEVISVRAQTELVTRVRAEVPGVRCVSVRDAGRTFVPERGYVGMMDPGDHGNPTVVGEFDLDEVLGTPSLKLVLRHDTVDADALLAVARRLAVPGVNPTTSGAPFLEVSAGGVNKATGLARYCALVGVERHEVLAFGDNRNDVELLAWAGIGVAVANALPEALAAADEVTLSSADDGVGVRIERLLADQNG